MWLAPNASGMDGSRGPGGAWKVSKPMTWKAWVLQVAMEVVFVPLLLAEGKARASADAVAVRRIERCMVARFYTKEQGWSNAWCNVKLLKI